MEEYPVYYEYLHYSAKFNAFASSTIHITVEHLAALLKIAIDLSVHPTTDIPID